MVEIYNDDAWVKSNLNFARTSAEIEAFRSQFDITPRGARIIAIQTWAPDFVSKLTRISIFFGTHVKKFWARFAPPDSYFAYSPFSSYIAPSLGSIENQEALVDKLKSLMLTSDRKVAEEGATLVALMEATIDCNKSIDFFLSRQRQFIAG